MGRGGAPLTGPDEPERDFIKKLLSIGFVRTKDLPLGDPRRNLRSTFAKGETTIYVTDTKAMVFETDSKTAAVSNGSWRAFAEVLAEIDPHMITAFACGCTFDEEIREVVAKCTDDPNRPPIGERGRIPCVRSKWSRDSSEVGRLPCDRKAQLKLAVDEMLRDELLLEIIARGELDPYTVVADELRERLANVLEGALK